MTDDEFADWFIANAERSDTGGHGEKPYTGLHYRKGWSYNNSQWEPENKFSRV